LHGRVDGIVYGAGFEADPGLLERLAAAAPLLGNPPGALAAVKDEVRLAALLARLGAPHPRIAATPQPGWMRKRRGGSGGTHIDRGAVPERGFYWQEPAQGTPSSALFAADGRRARLLGWTEQWTAPAAAAPWRFGGCAGPVPPPASLVAEVAGLCDALVAAVGLVGLNSLDLLVENARFTVLEVNPRPGATLDVLDGPDGAGALWRHHLDAVAGTLPPAAAPMRAARAALVLYAPAPIRVPAALAWPDWAADIPLPDNLITAGAPLCTVLAAAPDAAQARRLAERRAATLLEAMTPLERAHA
jgi:predicted ATP-grasp superfamily ATP-dependent carboligase